MPLKKMRLSEILLLEGGSISTVDEMQDTNPLQYKLLRSFIDKCHLFCVGDDAQSIYGFRGADFNTVHSFTRKLYLDRVL